MQPLSHTDNAAYLIDGINANLQEMGSVVVLTTSASASQMVSALNAEFYGISGVTELSTDMDAEDFVDALNENFDIAGGVQPSVKEQYEAEVADTISKVNALADEDTLTFFLVTDIHYNPREDEVITSLKYHFNDSVVNMKAVSDDTEIDSLLCLGDMIDGTSDTSVSESEASAVIADLRSVGSPLYIALGNHDNNRDGNTYTAFSRSSMQTMFMNYVANDVVYPSPDTEYGSVYYKDYDDKRLRLIYIYGNSGSNGGYSFNENTRVFLGNSLENLPIGYKAIVITHVPPCTKMNYNPPNNPRPGGEDTSSNTYQTTINGTTIDNGVSGIIQHYASKVIAMFYGHCHQDNVWSDPFVCIGTCCNKATNRNGLYPSRYSEDAVMPKRNLDNNSENTFDATPDLWDAVVVNQEDKRIDMVRFGAGADRTIHYEPVECAADSSITLTSKINGGTWGLRTSDQSKASVANGVVTVGSGIASGTLLSVWCKSSDWSVNSNKQLTAGSAIEYWTIKVI